jgi:pimeloyl-ACP methyl ester carboxylesterase
VPDYGVEPIGCPALFVAGANDPTLRFIPTRAMAPPLLADLRGDVRIPGAGHWVQREAAAQLTRTLLDYLAEVWPARR